MGNKKGERGNRDYSFLWLLASKALGLQGSTFWKSTKEHIHAVEKMARLDVKAAHRQDIFLDIFCMFGADIIYLLRPGALMSFWQF
jgi:hypothetical protein